jgi:hypothetical protein
MKNLILAFFVSLSSSAFAEVVKEKAITIGYMNMESIILREHKVNKTVGYSIERFENKELRNYKVLRKNEYRGLMSEIESILDKRLIDRSASQRCANAIFSVTKDSKETISERYCFKTASKDRRLRFDFWWDKARKAAY